MKKYKIQLFLFIVLLLALFSCNTEDANNNLEHQANNLLIEKGWVIDRTIDSSLTEVLKGINIISEKKYNKQLVLANQYNTKVKNQILVTPFRQTNSMGNASAFSLVNNNQIFVCPQQIKQFVSDNSFSDSTKKSKPDIEGFLGVVLLHELSHFALNISGSFDATAANNIAKTEAGLGQIDMNTEPEIMTTQKKLELKVDSLAIELIKEGIKNTKGNCFSICFSMQMEIANAEYYLFFKRTIENFGKQDKRIKDNNWTHPNIELRMAFMNYYLNPNSEKKLQIDNYIYQREIQPILNQQLDPRIYQGNSKYNLLNNTSP